MLAWLRLFRASGLLTVWSDALAACVAAFYAAGVFDPLPFAQRLLQGGWQPLWVIAASSLLYAAGMIWNDIADVERDRQLHPQRPLPSGRVRLATACAVGVLVAVGALVCAAQVEHGFRLAGAVLCLAFLYNFATKDVPWLGSLTLAAVRVVHALLALLVLGGDFLRMALIAPGGGWTMPTFALLLGIWVLGLAAVAELESRSARRWELLAGGGLMAVALLLALAQVVTAPWLGQLWRGGGGGPVAVLLSVVLAVAIAIGLGWSVARPWIAAIRSGQRGDIPAITGAALGGIILLDALVTCAYQPLFALVILLLYALFTATGRIARMG